MYYKYYFQSLFNKEILHVDMQRRTIAYILIEGLYLNSHLRKLERVNGRMQ